MSHFTNMKTCFHNLNYLEKALNNLEIIYFRKLNENYLQTKRFNLIIEQSNNYEIMFNWNGEEYEFIFDRSFWKQNCPVENFIEKIAQQYANEVIVSESQKLGFQPVKYQKNHDGSNTLVLERWNNTTKVELGI